VITKPSLIDVAVATPFDVEADALELLGATSIPDASVIRCQALTAPVAIAAALQVNAENLTLIVGGLAAGVHFITGGWAVADTVFRTQRLRLILSAPSLAIVEENESLPIDCDLVTPTLRLNIESHFTAPVAVNLHANGAVVSYTAAVPVNFVDHAKVTFMDSSQGELAPQRFVGF
jgi:hypothetical protein